MKRRQTSPSITLTLVGLLAALMLPSVAAAKAVPAQQEPPSVAVQAASFIAGHPTSVVCDATLGGHAGEAPAGTVPLAWTAYGGSTIYASPTICDEAAAPVGSDAFAHAIGTVIHEAAHARGFRLESCAEMIADIGVFDVLRRFFGVPFFTPMSVRVGGQVLALTRRRPADYQPEPCWSLGSPR